MCVILNRCTYKLIDGVSDGLADNVGLGFTDGAYDGLAFADRVGNPLGVTDGVSDTLADGVGCTVIDGVIPEKPSMPLSAAA
eukprot:CFRG7062T1